MMQQPISSVADGGSVLGKRPADESNLNDDQRFTKRFNLLSLGNRQDQGDGEKAHASSNYYIPVSPSLKPNAGASDGPNDGRQASIKGEELMAVDDTRDRVYVHNLDDELAEIESSDEERLIFLPDIEKKLSRLPSHVLTGQKHDKNQELVLYSVPQSLTPSEESDITRKTILEARQRARDKAAEEARQEDMMRRYQTGDCDDDVEPAHGYSGGCLIFDFQLAITNFKRAREATMRKFECIKPKAGAIDFSYPILVSVGQPAKLFCIPKVLCASSDYFKTALKEKWREGKIGAVELQDVDPRIFNIYANWLMRRKIYIDCKITEGKVMTGQYFLAFTAYALGDRLRDPDFKDAVTDAIAYYMIMEKDGEGYKYPLPCDSSINMLYATTTPGCTARRLVEHSVAALLNKKFVSEKFPPAFLVGLVQELSKKKRDDLEDAVARCAFHEHAPGAANCYRNKFK
ncbi:hypothetical protein KC332_g3248 [Hortaea werneckii]|nr:hypothetical protein KC358_g3313 [Hortaea werneckii]KAI6846129.1 hypothetical protein KC350_g4048 [Hortaea werneckii]KAI6937800.1 hypothetical protein KC341_g5334 [Hortaea werneckii]KAI6940708.1 hypothetical protein KC348_g4924 [Hortaea werneckii]KAI6970547.1 hypothetical protein KC329_g13360 [Hortaea werneckii]